MDLILLLVAEVLELRMVLFCDGIFSTTASDNIEVIDEMEEI